jgi:hypothetical protein
MAENVVYVTKGAGAEILKYTAERFKKFEKNILASGYRIATEAELLKKFNVTPVVEEIKPKKKKLTEAETLETSNETLETSTDAEV